MAPKKKAQPPSAGHGKRPATSSSRTATGPAGPKRLRPATACAVCAYKPRSDDNPRGPEWAELSRVGDQPVPVGDICKDCDGIRQEGMPYLERSAFIEAAKQGGEVSDDIVESRQIRKGGHKSLCDEDVREKTLRGVSMRRPYYFFNAGEYKHTFGASAPTGKKWPSLMLPKDDGTGDERVWYFKDDGAEVPGVGPHRRGEMFVERTWETSVRVMPKRFHRFARQAGKVVQHKLASAGYEKMKSATVPTVNDERSRLQARVQDDDGHIAEEEFDMLEEDQEAHCEKGAAAGAGGVEGVGASPSACAEAARSPASAKGLRSPAGAPLVTPTKGQSASSKDSRPRWSASAFARAASRQTVSVAGSGSIAGSGGCASDDPSDCEDDQQEESDKDDEETIVRIRIATLDCTKIMAGAKLGSQERRASELLEKLGNHPTEHQVAISSLKAHLVLVAVSKKLTPKSLCTLSEDELADYLKQVVASKVTIPDPVRHALVQKSVNASLHAFLASTDMQKLDELLRCVKPWGTPLAITASTRCILASRTSTRT